MLPCKLSNIGYEDSPDLPPCLSPLSISPLFVSSFYPCSLCSPSFLVSPVSLSLPVSPLFVSSFSRWFSLSRPLSLSHPYLSNPSLPVSPPSPYLTSPCFPGTPITCTVSMRTGITVTCGSDVITP